MKITAKTIDGLNPVIDYPLCPALIWTYGDLPNLSLIVGLANSGIPSVVGLSVKGAHHRICWARREVIHADGSITLKRKHYV